MRPRLYRAGLLALLFVLVALPLLGIAQTTFTSTNSADAFLATGSPTNPEGADLTGLNFGGAGTLAIAPASSPNGEYQSMLRFNVSKAIGLFDSTCGTNNWRITNISLKLASNFGTEGAQPSLAMFDAIHGGQFAVEWMADDSWVEGAGNPASPSTEGVMYDSISGLLSQPHEILGTNSYFPPGNNVYVAYPLRLSTNLIADVASGAEVSFWLYAVGAQISFLFNSHEFHGNEPLIQIAAVPARLEIVSGNFTSGAFHLQGVGKANFQYRIEVNTNLASTNWVTLGTVLCDSAGSIQYDDLTASTRSRGFYRLTAP